MWTMRRIPDLLRRFRLPASGPTEYIQYYNNFNISVGVNLARIYPQRMPCSLVFFQSDNANLGLISIGGQSTNLANGAELGAGQGVMFSADGEAIGLQRQLAGNLGVGIMAGMPAGIHAEDIEYLSGAFSPHGPQVVLDLSQFYAIATAGDQNLRVIYTHYTRIA